MRDIQIFDWEVTKMKENRVRDLVIFNAEGERKERLLITVTFSSKPFAPNHIAQVYAVEKYGKGAEVHPLRQCDKEMTPVTITL